MRSKFALLLALTFALPIHAELPDFSRLVILGDDKAIIPPGPVPTPKNEVVKAKIGDLVTLTVDAATAITFDLEEESFAGFKIDSNGKTLYLPTHKGGSWKVTAWTADKDGKPTRAKVWAVTIEGAPIPPLPPGPNPPPVPPADFQARLEQALAADGATDDDRTLVAAVYRLGVNQIPKLKLTDDLLKAVADAAGAAIDGRMPLSRNVVFEELAKRCPPRDSDLTDLAVQARCGKALNDLALALDSIHPRPPTPPPSPAPIPAPGFRVLVVYEQGDKLSKEQQAVLGSTDIHKYLNDKCVKVGSTPEYRIWDADKNFAGESELWKQAMGRKRDSLPWILISAPEKGGGFEGKLPNTVSETLELLKKYGG